MLGSQQGRPLRKAPRSRPYSCDVCPKQFETPSKLARHHLTHTGQRPFQCQDCSKTFRQLVHLERHMMTHALPFQCNVCLRHFKNADTFAKHQRLHTEGARVKIRVPKKPRRRRCPALGWYCFGCQRTFESEEKRLLHRCDFVIVPADRRAETQQCYLCDKTFPSRSKLERHVMIHTGQKPFACVLCGKTFRQKAHLKIHTLTHTQEKPYQCSQCFRSFKTPEQLLKHEEGHAVVSTFNVGVSATEPLQVKEEPDEGFAVYVIPFQCSSCNRSFDSQATMDGHVCEEMNTSDHHMGMNAHVALTCPIKTPKRAPMKKNRRSIFLEPVLFPTDSDPPERPLKMEHLEEVDYSEPNALEYEDFAVRNILHLLPQQKVKPSRNHFGQSHLHLGKPFRSQHLSENRMEGNRDVGTTHAAEHRVPFHHFLQQAQNILLSRHKVRRCDRCEKTFPSMSKLRRHYLIHTGQKPFSCTECGRNFRQSTHLKRHQVTHAEKERLYRSHIDLGDCHPSFDQWQENPTYQYACRPIEESQALSEITFDVPDIKAETETVDLAEVMRKPVKTKRARITLPRVRNAKSSQERPLQKMRTWGAQKRYRCSVCTKNFLSPSKLERHHLTHSGQRPYVCQECGKSFRQDPHLKRHMVTHVKMGE